MYDRSGTFKNNKIFSAIVLSNLAPGTSCCTLKANMISGVSELVVIIWISYSTKSDRKPFSTVNVRWVQLKRFIVRTMHLILQIILSNPALCFHRVQVESRLHCARLVMMPFCNGICGPISFNTGLYFSAYAYQAMSWYFTWSCSSNLIKLWSFLKECLWKIPFWTFLCGSSTTSTCKTW